MNPNIALINTKKCGVLTIELLPMEPRYLNQSGMFPINLVSVIEVIPSQIDEMEELLILTLRELVASNISIKDIVRIIQLIDRCPDYTVSIVDDEGLPECPLSYQIIPDLRIANINRVLLSNRSLEQNRLELINMIRDYQVSTIISGLNQKR